jgi:hypothetical protein
MAVRRGRSWQRRAAFDNVGTCLLTLCLRRLTVRAAVRGAFLAEDPAVHVRCLVMPGPGVVFKEETWQSD